ncbi:DUF3445 domain-containing protein [Roseomonas sp. CAU 1739]|uniref:heme-dependent oxidative N-demethylase family protein n=1 Tax=Roseomonas sp. CAU 1739 TaxID=3140364 RepID=UPI00325B3A5B
MALGLTSVPEPSWIELDAHYPAHLAERAKLLAHRRTEVLAAISGSEAMQAELLETLADHLCRHHPAWFSRRGSALDNHLLNETMVLDEDPLGCTGRLVQEDFCLLREEEPNRLVLIAAILCFPSRWRLSSKMGSPLGAIHTPVPMYRNKLERPVDRFLGALKAGRIAQRLNWSIMDDATLFQPTGHGVNDFECAVTAENAGETLVMRVERQTFRRLPRTGGIAFGIRVHVTALASIVAVPGEAARLLAAVRALPPEMERYKSMLPFRDALFTYLGRIA